MDIATEDLLAVFRQRFPQELEIAVLMVQNESLRKSLNELADDNDENGT